MDEPSTIVILSAPEGDWTSALEVLSERYAYRAILVRSVVEALRTLSSIHVDLVIGEDADGAGSGLDFFGSLRVSHPDVLRVYVAQRSGAQSPAGLDRAAVYQFLLKPVDEAQLGLVVEHALETREIRRMVALAKDGEYLTTSNLSPALLAAAASRPEPTRSFTPDGATLKDQVESLERQIVGRALAKNRWNQSRTANEFGLGQKNFSRLDHNCAGYDPNEQDRPAAACRFRRRRRDRERAEGQSRDQDAAGLRPHRRGPGRLVRVDRPRRGRGETVNLRDSGTCRSRNRRTVIAKPPSKRLVSQRRDG